MKRWTLRIALSFGIAVSAALVIPVVLLNLAMDRAPPGYWDYTHSDLVGWWSVAIQRSGGCVLVRASTDYVTMNAPASTWEAAPRWTELRVLPPVEDGLIIAFASDIGAGFPWTSNWYSLGRSVDEMFRYPSKYGSAKIGTLTVPCAIYVPGFVANVLVYAMTLLGASQLIVTGTQLQRRLRGRCPECAYDLRGQFDGGCSECGWNRPEDDA